VSTGALDARRKSDAEPADAAAPPRARAPLRPDLDERLRRAGLLQLWVLGTAALGAAPWLARAAIARRLGRPAQADAARERALLRGVAALSRLKGPFAKLGQFGAIRFDVLPAATTDALRALRDRVPPLPFARIRALVEHELGRPLEAAFARFEPAPVGAASIAQAHAATLHDGTEVVVKVQYPWLAASLETDLRIVRWILAWIGRGGRASGHAQALFQEFGGGLRDELDFEREAAVAAEIGASLADDASVVVPAVVPGHSTRRVLTVVRYAAVPIDDRAALARLGVEPRRVLEILARAYGRQMFGAGLFHADPHPGNLFVVDEPAAARRPRLLFVDFGLSRRLDPMLRRELRAGLFALMQRDLEVFVDGMERIGAIAPGHRDAVARAVDRMFERIQSHGGALAVKGSQALSLKDEAIALLRETPGLRLPVDLLLYAKTLSYVFSLGARLDPEVDMMKLSLPAMLVFLATPEPAQP
jgi:predicted unusual protein kinase regulating ubiquinone biosynthesis (AarF/ABC1/UbiB family)